MASDSEEESGMTAEEQGELADPSSTQQLTRSTNGICYARCARSSRRRQTAHLGRRHRRLALALLVRCGESRRLAPERLGEER